MSVPIQIETQGSRQPSTVPIVVENTYGVHGDKTSSLSRFDKLQDDFFTSFNEPMTTSHRTDTGQWFDDMRKRFDERRRQWDSEMCRMKSSFFNTPNYSLGRQKPVAYTSPPPSSPDFPVVTSYERGDDGSLHFLAQFDVKSFHQDSINVSVREEQVVVTTTKKQTLGSSSTSTELTRTVDLPKSAQRSLITATISADNILVVDVPLGTGVHRLDSPKFQGGSATSSLSTPSRLSETGGVTRISSPSSSIAAFPSNPVFHVEIPVGTDYLPHEIQIRTLNNRVYITARHEETLPNRNSFREFSKEYDIPNHIDPTSINARLEHGILHLEGVTLP